MFDIYNAIPVPTVVLFKDGVIHQVNKAAEKCLGLKSKQIIGHSNHELFHPSNLTVQECPVCQAIQNNQTIQDLELTDIIKKRVIQYSLSFIQEELQEGVIQVCVDVTEQKALQLKSTHQVQIIEQINDSVISMNLDGIIVSWNSGSKRLSGYRADEVIGKHISMLHRPEDMHVFEKALATLMETGIYNTDACLVKKSKDIISISISLSLLRDENGIPLYMIGYAHDISERKKYEEELLKQKDILDEKVQEQVLQLREKENLLMEQSKLAQMGDMINMIAHQWRQPLNVISTKMIKLSFLNERDDLLTQKVEEISKTIQQQVQDMSETITDFMNFNQQSNDKVFLLSTAVKDTLNIMAVQFESREIHMDVDMDKELKVFHNPKSISHSLLNLLVNARDAFEVHPEIENSVIKIYTKEFEDRVELIIEDNAGGIPKNIIDKVFNPYFTTKEQGKGTGIGLYMVKNLIEKVKGATIHLKGIDNGARFTIGFEK